MNLQKMWECIYQCVSGGNDESLDYWRNLPAPADISDQFFFSELAWCVFNGGMAERIIRAKWPYLSAAYHDFDPDAVINDPDAAEKALMIINHSGKVKVTWEVYGDKPTVTVEETVSHKYEVKGVPAIFNKIGGLFKK